MSKYIDLTDQRFGNLVARQFLGGPYGEWLCDCDCGNTYVTRGKYLRNGYKTHCNNCNQTKSSNQFNDLTGKKFNEWTVVRYLGNNKWECNCSCGRTTQIISGTTLKHNETRMCKLCLEDKKKHDIKYDMTGMIVGSTKVLKYISDGSWECQCSCGKIMNVKGFNLRKALEQDKDYKCEKCSQLDKLDDLTGRTFGLWHVDKYLGYGIYQCTCGCDNHTVKSIVGKSLKAGTSTSCGCLTAQKITNTRIKKYGDIATNTNVQRSEIQVLASSNADNLKVFIENTFDNKPTLNQLADSLGIGACATGRKIHKFNMESYIDYNPACSKCELEVYKYISEICNDKVLGGVRNVLSKQKELDIYIPNKSIAIEFNGTYWHSSIYKESNYHQQKSLECESLGIQLIHIFEYEWLNERLQSKIKNYLSNIFNTNREVIYARDTEVKYISVLEAQAFCEEYHLQGYVRSIINYGLFKDNELLGVMTFGYPRFNREYQYEILRLCYKTGVNIVGGAQKLFKHFIDEHNPESISK